MRAKRTSKWVFFVIVILIFALTYTAFFGISDYYGDKKTTYIKGASDIRWGIDISGGVEAVFTPNIAKSEITTDDMDSAKSIIETRLVNKNITDYETYVDNGNKQIIVRFPWAADEENYDPAASVASLGETAVLSFCKGSTYDESTVLFTGEHVTKATGAYSSENMTYVVQLELDDAAKDIFASVTSELAPSKGQIAICMDGTVLTAPQVNEAIPNGMAIISGSGDNAYTAESAKELADKINAGSLPFSLSVDDSKLSIVSATLGSNALNVMLIAGAIAFAVVCVLMIVRYRLHGFIAAIALLGQLAGSIAAISGYFSSVDSFTLTVPGIAGIILSIGVGVDCNVISAERIRDEFSKGKTIDGAIEAGFQNSLSAIIDGNMTIVIVAIVLMGAFGTPDSLLAKVFSPLMSLFGTSITGSIYSFGYTLLIGVIFNLIMGVLCSKWMLKSISQLKFLRIPALYGGKKNG